MDDRHNDEQRARATLRGKGREILLGQHADSEDTRQANRSPHQAAVPDATSKTQAKPDPSALVLTPEEASALLNFDNDSPVYHAGFEFAKTDAPSVWAAEHVSQSAVRPPEPSPPNATDSNLDRSTSDALDWFSNSQKDRDYPVSLGEPDMPVRFEGTSDEVLAGTEESLPSTVTQMVDEAESVPESVSEALPMAERYPELEDRFFRASYEPHEEVEALTPDKPEQWSDRMLTGTERETVDPVFRRTDHGHIAPADFQPAAPDDEGGVYVPPAEASTAEPSATPTIGDPFPALRRTKSEELFKSTPPPDKGMLDHLVDDEQLKKLWEQIEKLHEQLAETVDGDRSMIEEYQRELLRASGLLLESRQNFDDARAIVYRIRADLNRQRKVHADIVRYRPLLLAYYIGWGVALVVLFLLKRPLSEFVEDLDLNVFAALYYPLLLGITGALISGYLTLDRHTTKQRDFDPMHITWYLFNPLLGGIMGLLMFLLASIANEDLLQEAASRGETAITYLLCVIAGMNQNNVLRRLNELMDRFGSGTKK